MYSDVTFSDTENVQIIFVAAHRSLSEQSSGLSSSDSIKTKKSNSTQDIEYCIPPSVQWQFQHMLFHRDLELGPFEPKIQCIHLCPITHHRCKFGEILTNTFQDIVLTSPESAVSGILYSIVALTFDLLTRNGDAFNLCPIMHCRCKFGENVSNTPLDTMLTVSERTHGRMDTQMHECTEEQDKNSTLLATLCWAET